MPKSEQWFIIPLLLISLNTLACVLLNIKARLTLEEANLALLLQNTPLNTVPWETYL